MKGFIKFHKEYFKMAVYLFSFTKQNCRTVTSSAGAGPQTHLVATPEY